MLSYCGHEAAGVLVLTASEAEGGEEAMTQREWLYRTIEARDDPRFVVDLGAIPYMASSDIGMLITLKRRVDARKGKVVLVNVDPFVLDVLKMMRIDTLFTIAPDMAAALSALST